MSSVESTFENLLIGTTEDRRKEAFHQRPGHTVLFSNIHQASERPLRVIFWAPSQPQPFWHCRGGLHEQFGISELRVGKSRKK